MYDDLMERLDRLQDDLHSCDFCVDAITEAMQVIEDQQNTINELKQKLDNHFIICGTITGRLNGTVRN